MAKSLTAAVQQAAEIAKLERRQLKGWLAAMSRIQAMALQYQDAFNLRGSDLLKLQESVLTTLVMADLAGRDRARKQLKAAGYVKPRNSGVSLDTLSDVRSVFKNYSEDEVLLLMGKHSESTQKVMQNLTSKITQGVRDALNEAQESQVTPKAAIQHFFSKAGLDGHKPFYLETLLRTQTQLAYGAARWEEYNDPVVDEIMWGYEYVTVGDDRVRPEHAALDGVRLPKDDPFWQRFFPPNGYNCRCQALPVFDTDSHKKKQPPKGAEVDEGFDFNPSDLAKKPPGLDGEPKPVAPPTPPPAAPAAPAAPAQQYTPNDTPDRIKAEALKYAASLENEATRKAIVHYSESGYKTMNAKARAGKPMSAKQAKEFAAINAEIASKGTRFQPPPPTTLFRGVSLSPAHGSKLLSQLRVSESSGKPFSMKGVISTSANPRIADSFGGKGSETETSFVMRIQPKVGLPIQYLSSFGSEQEVLLQHDSQFKVMKVERTETRKPGSPYADVVVYIDMEQL